MIESNFTQDISALKKLPKTWGVFDFGTVFTDISGGNKKFLKSDFLLEGKVAIVDQGKDLIAGYTNEEDKVVKGQPPYIVFGDHTRIFKFIDFPFVMGADGTKVFKAKDITINNEKYLFHFLNSLNIPNTGYNRHFKYLKSTKIPLPPLPQQQKIANILDAADALRQNDKALIAKYDELTQALFLDMFGDPVSNRIIELGEVIKLIGGGTPSKMVDEYWNGTIPWASVKDLKSDILSSTIDHISEEGVNNSATNVIPAGSLIIATRMAVGKTVICKYDTAINQDLKAVKIIGEVNVKFLQHLFKSKESYFDSVSSGATVKGIKIEHITKLKVPFPTIDLQNQFAERVALIEEQKAIAQKSLEKSEELFNSLLQKAFKGELI